MDEDGPFKVTEATVDGYFAGLAERYRPPSRGGNTRAWHSHTLVIGEERYGFLALGKRKWVFVGDRVSFEWKWSDCKKYRNVNALTVSTVDKAGHAVIRGERGVKKWRTAPNPLPGSRRDQRD